MKNLQLSSFLSFMLIMVAQNNQGASTTIGTPLQRPVLRRTGAADYNTQKTTSLQKIGDQNKTATVQNQRPANSAKQIPPQNNLLEHKCAACTPIRPTSFLTQRPIMGPETERLRSGVRELNNFYKQTITNNIERGSFIAAQKLLDGRIENLDEAIHSLAADNNTLSDQVFFKKEKEAFIELQVQLNKNRAAYHAQNSSSTIQPLNQK